MADSEALVGGTVAGALVVVVRDLIAKIVPSTVPGASEIRDLTQRLTVAEQQILFLVRRVENLEEGRSHDSDRLDSCAGKINQAVGGINAIQVFLEAQDRPHAPRRQG